MTTYSIVSEGKKSDLLVLPLFEKAVLSGIASFDKELEAHISASMQKDFEGKKKQSLLLYGGKQYPRVMLVGLGEKKNLDVQSWKQAIGAAILLAQGKKAKKISCVVSSDLVNVFGARTLGQETAIAIEVAAYAFDEYKGKDARVQTIKNVEFLFSGNATEKRGMQKGINDGVIIADGVNFTRELGNTPPSIMTPTLLAQRAVEMCERNAALKAKVLSRPDMKKLGMGCLLGVSAGSVEEPKFIIVEYKGGAKDAKPTMLVGKGITFDSGGLSLKPGDYMPDMKFDMLGAATVLGTIRAAAGLGVKKNIIGLVPSCENMPSGSSYRPDDILVAMNGKSIEIRNTDAEGRLILADALSYATMRYTPKEVIDFATLTGACVVALGGERSGLFSPKDKMAENILETSKNIGENLWRLPLGEEYSEDMKSDVADYKNLGSTRYGGASTAAAFLEFFTLDPKKGTVMYPWAHIDLSSSYFKGKGKPWIRGGANGFGVQTMIGYLR